MRLMTKLCPALSFHGANARFALAIAVALAFTNSSLAAPETALPAKVTFNEHVAPILYQNCATCHRPNEIGPFPLTSYEDAKKRVRQIVEVTGSRQMPPWHADAASPAMSNDRRLTAAQIATLARWQEQGAPEGDPAKKPAPPKLPANFRITEPDWEFTMPEPYEVKAAGRDVYRNFVLPLNFTNDTWVKAIELRPGAPNVVHHILVFIDPTGEALKRDEADPGVGYNGFNANGLKFIVAWAPGGGTLTLPSDLAWNFPKGANLVLQTHIHPSGKPEKEATTVRLKFAKEAPEKSYTTINIPPNFGVLKDIYIPAGESNFVMRDSFVLPVDGEAFAVGGHAHEIGRSLQMTATLPDGTQKLLLKISDWDFAWQEQYKYRDRIKLPKGTKLETVVSWDNSAANPRNPHSPPRDMTWGEQTTNEMGSVVIAFIPAKNDDIALVRAALEDHVADQVIDLGMAPEVKRKFPRALRDGLKRIKDGALLLDANQDGKLEGDERIVVRGMIKSTGLARGILDASP
jgi:mono/diheme cytochrome c family protein